MTSRKVCLVTDEIHPLTRGGIGRLLHNLIVDSRSRQAPVEFHLMMPRQVAASQAQLDAAFGPGVILHRVILPEHGGDRELPDIGRGYYPSIAAFEGLIWQAHSHQFAIELMDLERQEVVFDEIEFPDFRGLAFAAIHEKRLGRGLLSSRLTVRIHSTFGVLRVHEPYPQPYQDQLARELERKALLEADQVIAHLPAIAAFNREFYGFDEDWLRRVRVEFPPVLDRRHAPATPPVPGQRPLVFASRSDPFKRPSLFIQGAAELMRLRPDYTGEAILACHIYHPEEIQALIAALPSDLRGRFRVLEISGEARDQLLASAVVVIPSSYESLSLLAYEASDLGAQVVLNEKCVAFRSGLPFVDGQNCFKFDGSVRGLTGALDRALQSPPLEPVRWTADPPYWETPAVAPEEPPPRRPLVSVVLTNRNRGAVLVETLESILASTYENLELVVVDDGSRDALDAVLFDRLEREAGEGSPVKVARHLTARGPAGAKSAGLELSTGEAVLFVDAGDLIQPTLLAEAAHALARDPGLAGVVPTVAYFGNREDLASGNCTEFATQLGDAPTPGLVRSSSGLHPVWRRTSLPAAGFDPVLGGDGTWLAYFTALVSGARFIPTPEVGYLARIASAGEELTPPRRVTVLGQLASEGLDSAGRGLWLASLLLQLPRKVAAASRTAGEELGRPAIPLRYNLVDLANRALKRGGPLHDVLRRVLSGALARGDQGGLPLSRPLRHELADRLNKTLKGIPGAHGLLRRLRNNGQPNGQR